MTRFDDDDYFVVRAVDVPKLGVGKVAFLGFSHTSARATIVATYER